MGKTIKIKEQNECLKADMVNLEEKLDEYQSIANDYCPEENRYMNSYGDYMGNPKTLSDYIDTLKQENKKLLADKQKESKEMLRRLERLNHFEDFVLEWDRDGFDTYLDEEGYKMDEETLEIVDKED